MGVGVRCGVLACGLALVAAAVADADVPSSEREALVALYESTSGDGWLVATVGEALPAGSTESPGRSADGSASTVTRMGTTW